MTTVELLTPVGSGAISSIRLGGPEAWAITRQVATRLNGRPWPERPELYRTYLARWAGDEVVIAVRQLDPLPILEIHGHGGYYITQSLMNSMIQAGAVAEQCWPETAYDERVLPLLTQARTLRTAGHLLDQYLGAFKQACSDLANLPELLKWCDLGPRLVSGWKLVIAGAPNVGKSCLINRLAGYDRAIVSPEAGTTRDTVSTWMALDGWPIDVIDTAGLRDTSHPLEREGIIRARQKLRTADLVLWVLDATEPEPVLPRPSDWEVCQSRLFFIWNKCDLAPPRGEGWPISALSGEGVSQLVAAIVQFLVPRVPPPGTAMPFTPELAARVRQAFDLVQALQHDQALRLLQSE